MSVLGREGYRGGRCVVQRNRARPNKYLQSLACSGIWARMSRYHKLTLFFCTALLSCVQFAGAQETKAKDDKAAFDPKTAKDGGLGMPTPYDKFLALDQLVPSGEINWNQTFRKVAVDIDPDQFTDKETILPMVLGVRIADGVMAIKARDVELLNKAASDIETLAKRMGVADADLNRARAVRAAANEKKWLNVFMELGFLQQDIMKKLENKESAARTTLLVVAGWLQGARYTTALIADHYTGATSNLLREPKLLEALAAKMDALPAASKENAAVSKVREVLPKIQKIIDIPLDGSVPKESVAELDRLCTEAVKAAVTAK
jgi:hypothetical protein